MRTLFLKHIKETSSVSGGDPKGLLLSTLCTDFAAATLAALQKEYPGYFPEVPFKP